jgi:hypothetical protein
MQDISFDFVVVAISKAHNNPQSSAHNPHATGLDSVTAGKNGVRTAHSAPHTKVCALRTPGKVCAALGLQRHTLS